MKRVNIFGNCPKCRNKVVQQYQNDHEKFFIKAVPIMDKMGEVEYLCKNCSSKVEINTRVLKSIEKFRYAIKASKIHPKK